MLQHIIPCREYSFQSRNQADSEMSVSCASPNTQLPLSVQFIKKTDDFMSLHS